MTRAKRVWPLLAVLGLAGCATVQVGVVRTSHGVDYPDVQAAAPGAASCPATTPAENARAAAMTSALRKAHGLGPVQPNPRLARAAAAHACDMARRGLMTHSGSKAADGAGPMARAKAQGYRAGTIAENIAAGPFGLDRVLAEWNASHGHVANIVIPSHSEVGIGRAIGSDGKTAFWAAVYTTPFRR